jgi:hypothetical protein
MNLEGQEVYPDTAEKLPPNQFASTICAGNLPFS